MSTVTRRRTFRVRRDQGAVATLVAMLLAGGVLLGFAALAIDVGRLYLEREELQSGADAAALAVAKACAKHSDDCASLGKTADLAQTYANANAADGATQVVRVCGHYLQTGPTGCGDEPADNLTKCLGTAPTDEDARWVEVRVATETGGGSTLLPPSFASGMLGNGDYEGTTVGACARYQWQTTAPTVLALGISECEFDILTDDETDFAAEPPYAAGEPDARDEQTIYVDHNDGYHECGWDHHGPGRDQYYDDGDPAWLDGASNCLLTSVDGVDYWIGGDAPGDGHGGSECRNRLDEAWQAPHNPIYLALFDEVQHRSDGSWRYHIVGYVPVVIAAYDLDLWRDGSHYHGRYSWRTGHPACDDRWQESCIAGFFVGPPVTVVDDPTTVRLIG